MNPERKVWLGPTPLIPVKRNRLILFDEDEEDEDKFNTTRMNPCNEIQEGVILHRIEEERIYFFNDNEKRWEYLDIYAEPKKEALSEQLRKREKTKGATPELGKGIKKVGGNSYEGSAIRN